MHTKDNVEDTLGVFILIIECRSAPQPLAATRNDIPRRNLVRLPPSQHSPHRHSQRLVTVPKHSTTQPKHTT